MRAKWKLLAAAVLLTGATSASTQNSGSQASPPGCITAASTAAEKTAAAERMQAILIGPQAGTPPLPASKPAEFGADIGGLARENVFGDLWSRCGLSRRDRSLVTLGMLIALRADGELRYHFPIAFRNGLTRRELEEVIYQASGYAGFPAATSARRIAEETLSGK